MFCVHQRHAVLGLSVLWAFSTANALATATAQPSAAVAVMVGGGTTGQPYQLPTVEVIGKRSGKSLVGKSILDQHQLNVQQANNVATLLESLPGVSMSGSPRPGGQTINMWGMGGSGDVPFSVDGGVKT